MQKVMVCKLCKFLNTHDPRLNRRTADLDALVRLLVDLIRYAASKFCVRYKRTARGIPCMRFVNCYSGYSARYSVR